jgi:hypothetical protein
MKRGAQLLVQFLHVARFAIWIFCRMAQFAKRGGGIVSAPINAHYWWSTRGAFALAVCALAALTGGSLAEDVSHPVHGQGSSAPRNQYQQLSDKEIRTLLSDVSILWPGGLENGWTRAGDEGAEFFGRDGTYVQVGRALVRGSFRIVDRKVCITHNLQKTPECRKIFKDASSSLFFAYEKTGFSIARMVRFRASPSNN